MKKFSTVFLAVLLFTMLPTLALADTSDSTFSTVANSVFFTKFRRFFTFDQNGKNELTLAIDNGLLIQAESQLSAGDTTQASATFSEFQQERASLHKNIDMLLGSKLDNSQTQFVRNVVTDEAAELNTLIQIKSDQVPLIASLQDESTKHITNILEKPSLSSSERLLEVTAVTSKVSEDVSRPEEKIAKKLALGNSLTDNSQSEELKKDLATEEDSSVNRATSLSATQINALIGLLQNEKPRHNLVVLQKLLNQAPGTAQPKILTALNDQAQKEATEVESHGEDLQKIGMDPLVPLPIRTAILERVKGKSHNNTTKKMVDQTESESKKAELSHPSDTTATPPLVKPADNSEGKSSSNGHAATSPLRVLPPHSSGGDQKPQGINTRPEGSDKQPAPTSTNPNPNQIPPANTEVHHTDAPVASPTLVETPGPVSSGSGSGTEVSGSGSTSGSGTSGGHH